MFSRILDNGQITEIPGAGPDLEELTRRLEQDPDRIHEAAVVASDARL